MKRILSIILAVAMCISILPVVSAEDVEATSEEAIVYSFKNTGTNGSDYKGSVLMKFLYDYDLSGICSSNAKYDASTDSAYANNTYSNVGRNWKYLGWSNDSDWTKINFWASGIQAVATKRDAYFALEINVPKAGLYSVSVDFLNNTTSTTYASSKMYILPENSDESLWTSDEFFYATLNVTNAKGSVTSEKTIHTDEDNQKFIVVFRSNEAGTIVPYTLTLTPTDYTETFDFNIPAASSQPLRNYTSYSTTEKNWYYLDMEDSLKASDNTATCVKYWTQGILTTPGSLTDTWFALVIKVANPGIYSMDLDYYYGNSSYGNGSIYILPKNSDRSLYTADFFKATDVAYTNDTDNKHCIHTIDSLLYVPAADTEFVLVFSATKNICPSVLTLTEVSDDVTLGISADSNLQVGKKASVSVTANDKKLLGAALTSTNNEVATVENGVITAIAEGDTVIKAEAGELSASAPLTVTHPNAKIEAATTAKIYITATDGVTLTDVSGTVQGSQLDRAINTPISATAPNVPGLEFKYWKNLSSGSVFSVEEAISFNLASNTSLMAVYAKKADGYLVEFANANRAIISSEYLASGSAIVAPALPSLTGYGTASSWSDYPEVVGSSDVQSVAIYDAPKAITLTVVNGLADKDSYNYNDKVTVTAANAPDGKVFSHWTRGTQIVSYDSEYSFYAWSNATLTANYADAAPEFYPTVILDDNARNDGEADAYMMELVGFEGKTILERGILFGGSGLNLTSGTVYKATSVLGAAQFSAMMPDTSFAISAVRAYVVYSDNGVIRIAYSSEAVIE